MSKPQWKIERERKEAEAAAKAAAEKAAKEQATAALREKAAREAQERLQAGALAIENLQRIKNYNNIFKKMLFHLFFRSSGRCQYCSLC